LVIVLLFVSSVVSFVDGQDLKLDQKKMLYRVDGNKAENWSFITDNKGTRMASISLYARDDKQNELKAYFDEQGVMIYSTALVEIKDLTGKGIYVDHKCTFGGKEAHAGYRYSLLKYVFDFDAKKTVVVRAVSVIAHSERTFEYAFVNENILKKTNYQALTINNSGMVVIEGVVGLPPLSSPKANTKLLNSQTFISTLSSESSGTLSGSDK
jgi:hypothetical protein